LIRKTSFYFILSLLIFNSSFLFGQEKKIRFVKIFKNEREISDYFEKSNMPLLIYNNRIYELSSDCISRTMGGEDNNRNMGGDVNARKKGDDDNRRDMGGDVNARKKGDDDNRRDMGGDVNARKKGNDDNRRDMGGDVNARKKGDDDNRRNLSGEFDEFDCFVDQAGNLIILFYNKIGKTKIKIYFNGTFFKSNSKYFSLINKTKTNIR
jgi:hypothetical protein